MNNKKKILFLVTQSEFGGAQRFIYRLVTNLNLDRYKILVAAGPEGDDKIGLLAVLEKNRINTKHLKYLRRGLNPFFDFCLGLIEIYKIIRREKPDILFLCSSKAGTMGSLIGRLAKVSKIIYRIGGWAFNDPWPSWKKKLYIWFERISAEWKDYIINNAESDRRQAIKLGIKPRKKILTIYNGIDVEGLNFLSKAEARKKILNTKYEIRDTKIIGTIANFYPAKGLEYLVRAANILKEKDIKFIVIGDGQERNKLEKLIEKYDLTKNVFLAGTIPEAYKYLKAFDMFVLPSVKEGFPWTVIEAMGAEVPVVATRVGAVPEIIEDNKSGILIEPRNSEELAKAIEKLLEDSNLREKLVKEAEKTVKEKFSLDRIVREAERLFVDP